MTLTVSAFIGGPAFALDRAAQTVNSGGVLSGLVRFYCDLLPVIAP